MEPTEQQIVAIFRRWVCGNRDCALEHTGTPSQGTTCRWCPKCGASSRRTYQAIPVAGRDAEISSHVVIRKVPTRGKLASMALRYDHALFAPKQKIMGMEFGGSTQTEISAVMTQMAQLHEEAAEVGFYRPELEAEYEKLLTSALEAAAEDRTAD